MIGMGGASSSGGGGNVGGGNGSGEVCDGADNDANGVIDDVDADADGICDCILVATLGDAGTWGTGDVFSAWLSARSNNGATSLGDQTLTPALLAQYQIIVAQDVHQNHDYTASEIQALSDWVAAGGGFMTLIGYSDPSEVTNVNRLLGAFGLSYDTAPILPKSGGVTVPITEWTAHPVSSGITAVGVDNGYEVLGAGTSLATGGGYVVARTLEVQQGHVLVWGDEWITYDSEWQQHPDYQVQRFWVNAIKWLTVQSVCQVPVPDILK